MTSRSRRFGAILLAVGAGILSAFYAAQCVRRGNDFRTMWAAWGFALRGENIYQVVRMTDATPARWRNPPFFVFATCPLGLLDVHTAGYVWFYIKLALVAACVWLLDRLRRRLAPEKPWLTWAPPVLAAIFINNDLTIGHMNTVSTALVTAALVAFVERRKAQAAVWGSLAAVAKGPAALLLLFFAAKRELRLFAASLGLIVVWTALPALLWGPSKTLAYTREFNSSVHFDTIFSDVENGWAENWGLPELVMRVTGQAHPDNRYGRTLELFRLPYGVSKVLAIACTGAVLAALLAFWWTRPSRDLSRFASPALQDAGLAATSVLLLSPVSRKAYFGILLLPYFVVLGALAERPKSRQAAAVLFAVSYAFALLTQHDLVGRPLAFFFERWHGLTFSLLALFAAQLAIAKEAA